MSGNALIYLHNTYDILEAIQIANGQYIIKLDNNYNIIYDGNRVTITYIGSNTDL